MRSEYDATVDALYITLRDEPVASTKELDNGTLVDLAATGDVVGIEVIQPSRPWIDNLLGRFGDRISPADGQMIRAMFGAGTIADGGRQLIQPTMESQALDACVA